MAKVHVLEVTSGKYNVVLHAPVPVSNNAAGKPWVEVLTKVDLTGKPSILDEGTGPGEISPAENIDLQAGTIIEFQASFNYPGNLAQLAIDIDGWLADKQAEIVTRFNQYGREIA